VLRADVCYTPFPEAAVQNGISACPLGNLLGKATSVGCGAEGGYRYWFSARRAAIEPASGLFFRRSLGGVRIKSCERESYVVGGASWNERRLALPAPA